MLPFFSGGAYDDQRALVFRDFLVGADVSLGGH